MANYQLLKKCRGTCQKGKDVADTNCIGFHPGHGDCRYSRVGGFRHGFCPYYNPVPNEKNYSGVMEAVQGIRYYRRPFRVCWFPILLILSTSLLYSVISGNIEPFLLFSQGSLPFFVPCFIIVCAGGFLYQKYGKNTLVAVINEDGIYTNRLLLRWEDIIKVTSFYSLNHNPYLVEMEIVMRSDEQLIDTESVYIYFSTLEMRKNIRKHWKQGFSGD